MAEVDYNTLLQVYQKKLTELMMQNIALEARIVVMSEQINSSKPSSRKTSTGSDK